MRISDWSSDVCSSDLSAFVPRIRHDDNARDQPEIVDQFVEKLLPAVRPQGCIKRHGHEFHKLAVDHITSRPIGEVVHHLFICELWLNIYQSSPMATSRCASLGRITGAIEPRLPLDRSEEHTSELQSLMRISYAVFCLKKKK